MKVVGSHGTMGFITIIAHHLIEYGFLFPSILFNQIQLCGVPSIGPVWFRKNTTTNDYLDLPKGAEWMMFGVPEKHHPLESKSTRTGRC